MWRNFAEGDARRQTACNV